MPSPLVTSLQVLIQVPKPNVHTESARDPLHKGPVCSPRKTLQQRDPTLRAHFRWSPWRRNAKSDRRRRSISLQKLTTSVYEGKSGKMRDERMRGIEAEVRRREREEHECRTWRNDGRAEK
jgi:hypothetical protein